MRWDQPALGRHGVRQLQRGSVGRDRRADRRRRSGIRWSSPIWSICWGADLFATNVHFWAKVEEVAQTRRAAGGDRSAAHAIGAGRRLVHLPIRIGTDAALALGVMHVLARDGLCDREYIAQHTLGFDQVEARGAAALHAGRASPPSPALRRPMWSGSPRCTARAKKPFIRLGWGMTRFTFGGQALRTVALLPGVTGAYGRYGGGALLATAASFELNYNAVRKPSGPAATRTINHLATRRGTARGEGPADPRAAHRREQSGCHLSRYRQDASRPCARGSVHRGARSVHVGHRALCRHRAAGNDLSGDRGLFPRLRHLLHAIQPSARWHRRARHGPTCGSRRRLPRAWA